MNGRNNLPNATDLGNRPTSNRQRANPWLCWPLSDT